MIGWIITTVLLVAASLSVIVSWELDLRRRRRQSEADLVRWIVVWNLVCNEITWDKIQANTVTADRIQAGSITASTIYGDTINDGEL